MKKIKLIVGLGNPGINYAQTRHNVGFWFVDSLCQKFGFGLNHNKKFHAQVAQVDLNKHSLWLLKPDTFMNLSGKAVAAIASFYKIHNDEILVIYDELDLPAGSAKLKKGGGHGGHNGLKDIINMTGNADFYRLRIGIGHPGDKNQVVSWVLNRANIDDEISINRAIDKSLSVIEDVLNGDLEKAMKALHTQ